MYQVISVGPVECTMSAFMQFHHGIKAHHGMIVFWLSDQSNETMDGMEIAWIHLLFSFKYGNGKTYECALVDWYNRLPEPDADNGMWMVEPNKLANGSPSTVVIHVDTILHCTHLIPVYDSSRPVPHAMKYSDSLDSFDIHYINKYADHHMYEVVI